MSGSGMLGYFFLFHSRTLAFDYMDAGVVWRVDGFFVAKESYLCPPGTNCYTLASGVAEVCA